MSKHKSLNAILCIFMVNHISPNNSEKSLAELYKTSIEEVSSRKFLFPILSALLSYFALPDQSTIKSKLAKKHYKDLVFITAETIALIFLAKRCMNRYVNKFETTCKNIVMILKSATLEECLELNAMLFYYTDKKALQWQHASKWYYILGPPLILNPINYYLLGGKNRRNRVNAAKKFVKKVLDKRILQLNLNPEEQGNFAFATKDDEPVLKQSFLEKINPLLVTIALALFYYKYNHYDQDGLNHAGYNREGYDRNGYGTNGHNPRGFNQDERRWFEILNEQHYKTLGLENTATKSMIKKAYRDLALLHHPDKNNQDPDAGEKFKKINNAYQVLIKK